MEWDYLPFRHCLTADSDLIRHQLSLFCNICLIVIVTQYWLWDGMKYNSKHKFMLMVPYFFSHLLYFFFFLTFQSLRQQRFFGIFVIKFGFSHILCCSFQGLFTEAYTTGGHS
jgi:hypothetical protein